MRIDHFPGELFNIKSVFPASAVVENGTLILVHLSLCHEKFNLTCKFQTASNWVERCLPQRSTFLTRI